VILELRDKLKEEYLAGDPGTGADGRPGPGLSVAEGAVRALTSLGYREPEVRAKINVALGGRAAEELVFHETSTGAESDIQQLTEIARQMVGRWGMSSAIGPVAVIPRDGAGPFLPGVSEVSSDTQRVVDEEVRRIVDESHEQVAALLQEHRSQLDSLASALLEHETLDEEDAYAAAGVPRAETKSADSYSAAARSRVDR